MMALTSARHFGGGLFYALATLGTARMSPPREPRSAATRLADALGAIAVSHDLAPTVLGEIPRGAALLVSNHVSYLDPLAILPVAPALPVVASDVEAWPLVGSIGKRLGVMFVPRRQIAGRARILQRMHHVLASGTSVLNFPEGATTTGGSVGPFFSGGFGVAAQLDIPVVPLAIRYADPALAWARGTTFLPHYLDTLARRRIDVTLSFGAPLFARAGEGPERMAARARTAVQRLLAAVPPVTMAPAAVW